MGNEHIEPIGYCVYNNPFWSSMAVKLSTTMDERNRNLNDNLLGLIQGIIENPEMWNVLTNMSKDQLDELIMNLPNYARKRPVKIVQSKKTAKE